jgi:undecaprenyl-diphosphatase
MKMKRRFFLGVLFSLLFTFWTLLVKFFDVSAIGPNGSLVGFASINAYVHGLFGVNLGLYELTDVLSLIPLGIVVYFALLGLCQLIKRKDFKKIEGNIIALGGLYLVVFLLFLLFEKLVINYRPILISGKLEASYPSSTTMLCTCVLPTAIYQFNMRIKNNILKNTVCITLSAFTVFMVVGRLVSGVHWFTDIVGGLLLSIGLVLFYTGVCDLLSNSDRQ